ncbi:MAG: DNA translocase FtsK [Lachnospiraceae bacterium]|nr:DNA translocase FtsK [Lachnospiraceae bacterium]
MASNTRNRKKSNSKNKRKVQVKHESYDRELIKEIRLVISFSITVFVTLSCFGLFGAFGSIISKFMFGCFGIIAYIVPLITFFGVWFFIANISNSKAIIKFIAGCFGVSVVCAFFHLLLYADDNSYSKVFSICGKEQTGGGVLGALIGGSLESSLSIYGAYFILVVLAVIIFIVVTEKSFVGGVKNSSRRMYDAAKEDYNRLKEESAEHIREKEYKKNRRINKKVTGIGDTRINGEKEEYQGMHEVTDISNKSVYRGRVEIEEPEINENTENIQEPQRVSYYEENVPVEPTYSNNKQEEQSVDENEPFTPKEKIEVSQSAMDVMNRKAFSTGQSNIEVKEEASDIVIKPSEEPSNNKKKVMKYTLPPITLLNKGSMRRSNAGRKGGLSETAIKLQQILENFGVNATVTNESKGPSVTRYELQPEMGTKVSKITSLTDDIKLNLAASDIRIEAPIPGKAAVGIEVPNTTRESVLLRDLIESDELKKHPSKIAFAAGMDIAGNVIVADIAKMPHMLIAGTTGSGKSVFTNSIIQSILFRATPEEVRMIIVDPKVVEFGIYNGIPHLLIPVVTDPKKAAGALAWAVAEMTKRYKAFADYNVRDLKGYNEKIESVEVEEGEEKPQKLPQIVIIIDELADLMMVAAKEVEESICRLAQLARAAGIHLIIATQRPSVDVVTGLIKANVPSRVALLVSSGTDSRTIIDMNGAEKLLGNGDMLFYPSGYVKPVRLQGAFVSDAEVSKVVEYITSHSGEVEYDDDITSQVNEGPQDLQSGEGSMLSDKNDGNDEFFEEAGRFVIEKDKASISMLQRMFKIGFNRAARIVDQLEAAGVVGEEDKTKPRKILMTMEEFENYLQNKNNGGNE